MDNSPIQRIGDILSKQNEVSIVVGRNPNLDEMAAALSLYLSLKQDKKVSIASPSTPVVEISSLVGIDKVKTSLETGGSDLVVSFPYRDREIEKVSYTLDGEFLNIVVKAGQNGLSFSDKDVVYKRGGGSQLGVLCVVGTPRLSDLGNLFDPEALKDTTVINIDNKPHNQGFGDVVFVSPRYSSVSEQMAYLLRQLNMQIDQDIAQNLLSGILSATDNFQKPHTSANAFEMTGFLMRKGAVRDRGRREVPPAPRQQFERPDVKEPQRQHDDLSFFSPPKQQQPPPREMPKETQKQADKAPADWLTPKIYKGSTEV